MIRVAIAGASGRMGRTLLEALKTREDLSLAGAIVSPGDPVVGTDAGLFSVGKAIGVIATDTLDASSMPFDVLVDFTTPSSALAHYKFCEMHAIAMVIGTTGFSEDQILSFQKASVPLVLAANMSIGVTVCLKLLKQAASAFGGDVDVEITEAHHRFKKDSPSGTALEMGRVVASATDRDLRDCSVFDRSGRLKEREKGTIGFSSLRGGDIIGDHTVMFAGLGERVEISHRATNRMTFASGALRAASWVVNRKPGLYSMEDVLDL